MAEIDEELEEVFYISFAELTAESTSHTLFQAVFESFLSLCIMFVILIECRAADP